jgi:excisionase family DNA binding protein
MNNLNLLTVKELQEKIPLKSTHIYTLIKKNEIPYIKLGGKYLFDAAKIDKWLESKYVNNL